MHSGQAAKAAADDDDTSQFRHVMVLNVRTLRYYNLYGAALARRNVGPPQPDYGIDPMKRILFVDDEAQVLAGLRSRLHRLRSEWDMSFAETGAKALELLAQSPFDVIVTDVQMPQMDGAELLRIVSRQWPQMVRILLSGYSDSAQIARLASLAHQSLTKPCAPQQLESVVNRCLALQELLDSPHLRAVVGRIRTVPAMPQVYSRLRAALADEATSARQIAELIAAEPAVTAKVLQMVNSAFFRLARRITRIDQAVAYLGFTAIRNLTLTAEVFSSWSQSGAPAAFNFDRMQKHIQAVATAASALARDTAFADDAMLAGLLHDIGYWVLGAELPDELARAVDLALRKRMLLESAETAVIGASHAEIGAYLLGIWGLPYPVVEAVAHHHAPERIGPHEFDTLAALAVAHSLVPENDAGTFGTPLVPDARVDADYLEAVHAPFSWSEAQARAARDTQPDEVRS
ncbi:MAG TPA: response regulator [Steroidobacteraceae bacterium]|nr:response regulator [Steroidobacteraceae bacterium]